ncbi:hypothetical protein O7632_01230 [Solwaraspora sp. WMMD406]|uniref:hypothetical protein n=1 Tax=Solwaraspora sp. WMMD406 TaxID=3016095 RepID=UPI002415E0BD|nr:hypothetical protein [Solwaraspora sp. WMMD406]MDG4762745.1 hypothetical protein [Solwaraspora sp. WMMD406]
MTEPNETALNPGAARTGGVELTGVGDDLAARWERLAGTINSLNSETPWGDDEPGRAFNEHYLAEGEDAPVGATMKSGGELVTWMHQLGPSVVEVVDGTVDVDEAVATWFGGGDETTARSQGDLPG